MWFNKDIQIFPGEDPFSPEEVANEPPYRALHWEEALKKGREVTRYAVKRLEEAGILNQFEDRLALRMDRFVLSEDHAFSGGGAGSLHYDRPIPQPWHFDSPILDDPEEWTLNSPTGLLSVGQNTGQLDVMNPFEWWSAPKTKQDLAELSCGLRFGPHKNSEPVEHESYGTGTLLWARSPFLHRRGLSHPGQRAAVDFGLLPSRRSKRL